MTIECLESRIAPAAVFVNGKTASFVDGDGDSVRVVFSKAILTASNVGNVVVENGDGLELLDLTVVGAAAKGTNVMVSVTKRAPGGDGYANVGFINAEGIDLGAVSLAKSDLGKIVVGDGSFANEIFTDPTVKVGALKSLTASSIGILGTLTQGSSGDLKSAFNGAVGSVLVKHSIYGGQLDFHGKVSGIGIGGSLYGGNAEGQGSITVDGYAGAVAINGDLVGGAGTKTGYLRLKSDCGAVFIGGSIRGGTADDTGGLTGSAYRITVNGDIRGGNVTVPGQVLSHSGFIISPTTDSLTVRGSLLAGVNNTATGSSILNASVSIQSGRISPSVVTVGSMIGNVGLGGVETSPAIETSGGLGQASPTISKLTVKGDMIHASIRGGYFGGAPYMFNAGTSLGTVTVAGDFIASSITTSVGKGLDGKFGGGDDTFQPGGAVNPSTIGVAKIASIVIGGNILGDGSGSRYAIAAEHIAKLTVGGSAIPLTVGKSNDALTLGFGGNVFVEEVSRLV